ncbi:MAG: TolC family protein [bacterium]
MRKYIIFVAIFAFCGSLYSEITSERIYTVDKSVEDAMKNNQSILFAQEEIKLAQSRVKEAYSLMYPQVELQTNATFFEVQSFYPLSGDFGSVLLNPYMDDTKPYINARAVMKQVIYKGGQILSTKRLANIFFEQAKSRYNEIKNEIVYKVRTSFYRLLLLQEKKTGLIKGLNQLQLLDERYSTSLSDYDSLQLLMEINSLNGRIDSLNRDKQGALLDFIHNMNIEQDLNVVLDGSLEFKKVDIDLNKCLAWAEAFRPELKASQFQEEIDTLVVNLSKAERYPKVLFGTGYEFSGSGFPLEDENWNATLSLNLPIFDGWAQWSRVRQKRAQARKGKLTRNTTKDLVHLQVRKAFNEYNSQADALSRIESFREDILKKIVSENNGLSRTVNFEKRKNLIKYEAEINNQYLEALSRAINAQLTLEYVVGRTLEQ